MTAARRWWPWATVVAVLAVVAALVAFAATARDEPGPTGAASSAAPGPPDAPVPALDAATLVAAVPHRAVADVPAPRVAADVVPPSNRWYSGLVYGDQPVFAQPLSFALDGPGFTLGLPRPVASATTIAGPHVAALTVDLGAATFVVTHADPVAVTIEARDAAGDPVGTVTLAEGSPVVTFTAASDVTVRTAGGLTPTPDGPAAAAGQVDGTVWQLVGPSFDDGASDLTDGDVVGWYALPDDAAPAAAATLAAAAAHAVTRVDIGYGVDDDVARTTLTYRTDGPGAYVLAPHQRAGTQPGRTGCGLGTYPSVGGPLELCAGAELTAFAPTVPPAAVPDVGAASDAQVEAMTAAVAQDVAATQPFPSDTYFGGKALFRAATLVVLAERLGDAAAVADLRSTTADALREWAQPAGCVDRDARCFVYDEQARSVIGLTPSFGSDQLNDHHFHYGYLLAAAGILGADDPGLVADLRPVMDLLAADVAAAVPSDELPVLRSFDPYAGHSWASGTSPFADGNNQESSSEAVNAWNGLALWARASGRTDLATEATWLLSTESLAARTYWTAPDLTPFPGFGHQVVSLVWGGKRDWATWFSPDPDAILGIQLIPMGPAQAALATDVPPERIRAAVTEATPDGYDVAFGGYLLAYLALAGEQDAHEAWDALVDLPPDAVDDGTSRTALLAFVAARLAQP